jgi:hypothetical protein
MMMMMMMMMMPPTLRAVNFSLLIEKHLQKQTPHTLPHWNVVTEFYTIRNQIVFSDVDPSL